MKFEFRKMTRDDLALMHRWLNLPHVAEWWGDSSASGSELSPSARACGPSLEEVTKEYGEYIDGVEPIHPYIAYADGVAIGHLQWMRYRDYPKYMQILRIDDPSSANCDVFIADEHFLHRGVGAPMIRAFVDEIIFADGVTTCFIDPDARNKIAIRAYEKAGFRFVRQITMMGAPPPNPREMLSPLRFAPRSSDDGEGDAVHLMVCGNRPET